MREPLADRALLGDIPERRQRGVGLLAVRVEQGTRVDLDPLSLARAGVFEPHHDVARGLAARDREHRGVLVARKRRAVRTRRAPGNVERRATFELVGAEAEDRLGRSVVEDDRARAIVEHDPLDHAVEQRRQLAFATGELRALPAELSPDPAKLEQRHRLLGQEDERLVLRRRQLAGPTIDRAERPHDVTIRALERDTGIEPHVRRPRHVGVIEEPRVSCRIRHDERRVHLHRLGAEREHVGRLWDVDAVARHEPLALLVDQRHQGDRRIEGECSQPGDRTELRLGSRVEHVVRVQDAEPSLPHARG